MKNRLLFVPVLVALVVSLAACGGGSQHIPAGAIAVVKGAPITLAQYNDFFAQAVAGAQLQGRTVSPGTADYAALRNQTVAELVQLREVEQQMKKEGVTVTPADIDKFIADLIQTNFHGSRAKFLAALKKSKLSMKAAREQVYIRQLATKMHDKVTASAKVTDAEERAYYTANLAQYATAAATTRNVAHILVKTKAIADEVEQKLRNGANFTTLMNKYIASAGSGPAGGELCISKNGQSGSCSTVLPPFGKAAFALKTGKISAPVHTVYGWHIIKAVGPTTNVKAHTQTFAEAKASIYQALLSQAQQTLWDQWLADLQNEYKGNVDYQSGYAPPTTTALPSSVTTPTTTG